ncbi:hypothetical protein BBJ29_008892 [Phytophthora kernoviae]|uniref:Tyr recombinase domain-containing protein n=1 Tax=Phytophthora kernoviae TaxID=325452 RepID=A0A3R7JLM5_9STRA|nr:hypothetical protein BBJ29_008892 [Phytophthora kernoviae]
MDLLEQWPEIIISPFGVVDKGGDDAKISGRTIHDLSYPEGSSINDFTDQDSITKPDYSHCDAVATEILRIKHAHPDAEVHVMAGDVASAFRNIGIHSNSVYLFAGRIEEENVLVIELAAPFGWTGSPGFYEIFSGAIAFMHDAHTNATCPTGFFNYHWIDDHISVAADIGASCCENDRSLRFAMVAVLGADAINTEKFSDWNTRQRVLGLEFDSVAEQILMPQAKIDKARGVVATAYFSTALTRKAYRSLLGSLRHVATCTRAARPFLQRLRQRERHLHRFRSVPVTEAMKQDLLWWWLVLHTPHLNGVSLEYFNSLPSPDVVIEMDASDFGLCSLDVTAKVALTYPFSPHELDLISEFKTEKANGFDINFRELLSCAFAVHAWGERWSAGVSRSGRPRHIHFRIDNTSAVAWQNKLSSRNPRNPRAQGIIRLLNWWETSLQLRFSVSHVAGVDNARADAGSRSAGNRYPGSGQSLAAHLRAHSVADSTFHQYNGALTKWKIWTSRRGISPWFTGEPMASQVQHISDFILHGFQFGYGSGGLIRSDSILVVFHGVRHFFAASGFEFPIAHPHIPRKHLPMEIPAAIYMDRRGTPACVTTADVSEVIKRATIHVGQDPRRFSSHSLRTGGATNMYRSGTDALTIQFHGRWVSDAFKTYTRLCKESVSTLSANMVAGSREDSTLH